MKLRAITAYTIRLAFLIAVGLTAWGILRTREFFGNSLGTRKAAN